MEGPEGSAEAQFFRRLSAAPQEQGDEDRKKSVVATSQELQRAGSSSAGLAAPINLQSGIEDLTSSEPADPPVQSAGLSSVVLPEGSGGGGGGGNGGGGGD